MVNILMHQFRQAYCDILHDNWHLKEDQTYGGLRVTRMVKIVCVTLEMYLFSISSLNAGTVELYNTHHLYQRLELGT